MNSYILSVSLLSAIFLFTPTTTEVAHVAEAHSDEKVAIVERISREMDFDPQIVKNVIDTETGRTWDCNLVGSVGELGCYQIIPEYHDVDPLDFEASTRYFITMYKAGYGYLWTGCSCMSTARLKVKNLPRGDASDLVPNATLQTGKIAILDYGGEIHAVAYEIVPTGIFSPLEGNFEPCVIKSRLITWDELEKHVVGFYSPDIPPTGGD